MKTKKDISELVGGIIVLTILALLSSCTEQVIEPELPTEYNIIITKDCFSCRLIYRLNSQEETISTSIQSARVDFQAYSSDTIQVFIKNIKVGSVFHPTEGYLTIASADTVEEHSIGRLTKTYILE